MASASFRTTASPEPGAAEAGGVRGIDVAELLEDALAGLGRDAGPRVIDDEGQTGLGSPDRPRARR